MPRIISPISCQSVSAATDS